MILATALLMLTSFAANPCQSAAAAETADALAAKFDDHQFVFIGSTHGDLKIINARCAHDFRVGTSGFAHTRTTSLPGPSLNAG